MKNLNRKPKYFLTFVEAFSVFLTVFLSQMITTVFPAYSSVKSGKINNSIELQNCSMEDPSNVYVAILIGSKYGTELVMFPIVGWLVDNYHPPLILFCGAIVEAISCIIYSVSENLYSSILGRIIDAIGYSIVSTSGLTIIYTLYSNERSRNKVITIDSVLVYIAGSISPIIAGSVYELVHSINKNVAHTVTFLPFCLCFLILAILMIPFAFRNSCFSRYFNIYRVEDKCRNLRKEEIELNIDNLLIEKVENQRKKFDSDLPLERNYHISKGSYKKGLNLIPDDKCEFGSIKNSFPSECRVYSSECSDKKFPNPISDSECVFESMKNGLSSPGSDQIIKEHKSNKDEFKEEIKKPLTVVTLLKDPHIMIVLFSLTFNSLIGNSLETTLPIFMLRKFCSDQTQQGTVWLFGNLSLTGFFLSSIIFHKLPQVCWSLPMIGLVINGSLCVILYFSKPWWVIGICLGFMFFFSSMSEVILIPVIPKIIDVKYSKTYGNASMLTLIAFTISGLIGTFPIGPLVEYFGFLTLCVILCILNCILAPFILFLRKYFT